MILGKEIKSICKSGADSIHLDIMDGQFVPNISFGIQMIKAIKKESTLPLKIHLMVTNPEQYIDDLIENGSDTIIFHQETVTHCNRMIDYIKNKGVRVGISITPHTHEHTLKYVYQKLDEILVMTVDPGFCGQHFCNNQLQKIHSISKMINDSTHVDIGIDGGINPSTLRQCVENGANLAIVGDYIFKSNNYKLKIKQLMESFNMHIKYNK